MRPITHLAVFLTAISFIGQAVAEDITVRSAPPVVVKSVPQSGDVSVDPTIKEIRVTFSKRMADNTWSWSNISEETTPKNVGKPHYLEDRKTCVLPVKLEPSKTYAFWINSPKFGNFKDAGGKSAIPYLLIFETKSASTKSADKD